MRRDCRLLRDNAGLQQFGALGWAQAQRIGQRPHRLGVGRATLGALERADRLGGEPRFSGKLFLRQAGALAIVAQLLAKRHSRSRDA